MTNFVYDPPLSPPASTGSLGGFVQTIKLIDGKTLLAVARWHITPGEQGVVQLLELTVDPIYRRTGIGGRVLGEVVKLAHQFHRDRAQRARRMWVSVEQKTQVNARAFFTKHGFHHTATINNLLSRQDALIYVKGMD